MREIVYVEKNTVIQDGKAILEEKRWHGLLGGDGSFHLLGYCGKRFPNQRVEVQSATPMRKKNKAA